MGVIIEGFLVRRLGVYNLNLIELPNGPRLDVSADIDLFTSLSSYKTIKLRGFSPVASTPLSEKNGYNIKFNQNAYLVTNIISIDYTLEEIIAGGKILSYSDSTNNYFLYLLAPEIRNPDDQAPKEYVFVIDVSGSMNTANRITQAKNAFTEVIKTLNDKDRFNVISFETIADNLWAVTKVANQANIDEALSWVGNLVAAGSTNFNGGVLKGLESFEPSFEAAKALTVLSDGVPTIDPTDTETIRNNTRSANSNEVAIFTIAFGETTAEGLMATIAYDSGGNFQKIADGANAGEQLLDFYGEFSTPVATGFSIDYTNAFEVSPSMSQLQGPLFNGSEIIQVGKFSNQLTVKTTINFNVNDVIYNNEITEPGTTLSHIERIWGINRIKDMVKFIEINGPSDNLKDLIVKTAIKYGIVVEGYTALIIIINEPSKTTEERDITEPSDPRRAPVFVRVVDTDTVDKLEAGGLAFNFTFVLVSLLLPILLIRRRKKNSSEFI